MRSRTRRATAPRRTSHSSTPTTQTVFPRGLLAPLIQWTWSTGDADAIQISLKTTSGSFSYTGTFAAAADPAADQGGNFIRMPIPQDVWAMATNTAGGPTPSGKPDQLTMSLVVAKAGVGYGPISETWTIAPGAARGHRLLQLVRHAAREELARLGPQRQRVRRGGARASTRARPAPVVVAGPPSPAGHGHGVPRLPRRLVRRQHAHRAARRQLRRDERLRPEERQRRERADQLRQHLRLGGALGRRHAGAHQHGRPGGQRLGDAALRVPAGRERGEAAGDDGHPREPLGRHAGVLARHEARRLRLPRRHHRLGHRATARSSSRSTSTRPRTRSRTSRCWRR